MSKLSKRGGAVLAINHMSRLCSDLEHRLDSFLVSKFRVDANFEESKHPRGQPENAGQFGSGGGSPKKEKIAGGEEEGAGEKHTIQQRVGTKVLEGSDFSYHPDYVYHGTSSKNMREIEKHGLKSGTYLSTSPMTAETEAEYTVSGDPFSKKATKGVGGETVVLAIPKSLLKTMNFDLDKEYLSDCDYGRAVIIKKSLAYSGIKQMTPEDMEKQVGELKNNGEPDE